MTCNGKNQNAKKKKKLQIWSFEISFYRVKTLYLKLYEKLLEIPQVKYHFSKIPPIKKYTNVWV